MVTLNLSFCKPLETATTACDVFDMDRFLKSIRSVGKVCGICTDGAPATLACPSGCQSLVLMSHQKALELTV